MNNWNSLSLSASVFVNEKFGFFIHFLRFVTRYGALKSTSSQFLHREISAELMEWWNKASGGMALDVPVITNTCRSCRGPAIHFQHPCQGAHKSKIYSFNGPNSLFWPIKFTPIHIFMKIKEILDKEMNKDLVVPMNHPLQPSSSSPFPEQCFPHSLDCPSS